LVAAEAILTSEGVAGLNTKAIAKKAGVSVGSLYQYFPNKQAIVRGVAERLERRGDEVGTATFESVASLPVRDVTRAMVKVFLSTDLGERDMRRALLRDVPARWLEGTSEAVDAGAQARIAALLASRPDEVRPAPSELQAFVVYHAVEAVVEAALRSAPELLDDAVFAEELFRLGWGYLRPDRE